LNREGAPNLFEFAFFEKETPRSKIQWKAASARRHSSIVSSGLDADRNHTVKTGCGTPKRFSELTRDHPPEVKK